MQCQQHKPQQPSVGSPKRRGHESIGATCTCRESLSWS